MSLKTFHLVFIVLSVLLALFFGVWAGYKALVDSSTMMMLVGLGSLCGGAFLVFYGTRFVQKLKNAGIY